MLPVVGELGRQEECRQGHRVCRRKIEKAMFVGEHERPRQESGFNAAHDIAP